MEGYQSSVPPPETVQVEVVLALTGVSIVTSLEMIEVSAWWRLYWRDSSTTFVKFRHLFSLSPLLPPPPHHHDYRHQSPPQPPQRQPQPQAAAAAAAASPRNYGRRLIYVRAVRLAWNATTWGVKTLAFREGEIWTPDVTLYEKVEENERAQVPLPQSLYISPPESSHRSLHRSPSLHRPFPLSQRSLALSSLVSLFSSSFISQFSSSLASPLIPLPAAPPLSSPPDRNGSSTPQAESSCRPLAR
eukprot:3654935-Rhodomonas_salina.1